MYNLSLHFHFVGIGGTGMAGIAEVLKNQGFLVSGSDLHRNERVCHLESLGVSVSIGHAPDNLPATASLVVYSTAVDETNPEIIAARERNLPVIHRAAILAELMRLKFGIAVAGSHGKTTTTSLVASILEQGGLDPSLVLGGRISSASSGGRLGQGKFLVAEADESDKSFLLLKPTICVVTNIDNEHLQPYGSFSTLEQAFLDFCKEVPFYGLAILCTDCPAVRVLWDALDARKLSYGISPDSNYRVSNIEVGAHGTRFKIHFDSNKSETFEIPLLGRHSALNATAAIAVGIEVGVSIADIKAALKNFSGIERRMERLASINGVLFMSDYGHHPVEIKATLSALKEGLGSECRRIKVVFQPHRFSRTRDCFVEFLDAFEDADCLCLTDIYPAGEAPIPEISSEILFESIKHKDKIYLGGLEEARGRLQLEVREGDLVLFLGAGSIGSFAKEFVEDYSEVCRQEEYQKAV